MDAVLTSARANYQAASQIALDAKRFPDLGSRWAPFCRHLQGGIPSHSSAAEAIRWCQVQYVYDHRTPVGQNFAQTIETHLRAICTEYPELADKVSEFEETPHSIYTDLVEGGPLKRPTRFSTIHFFHVFYILTCLRFDKTITDVCHVGGAYGNPARLWLTNPIHPIRTFCDVDLPESLFYAECFLRTTLPGVRIEYILDPEQDFRAPAPGEQCIILCPLANIDFCRRLKIDVVQSTGTLPELGDSWNKFYCDWLSTIDARLYYVHNYFGNPVNKTFEANTAMAPRVPPDWRLSYSRPQPPMMSLTSAERLTAEMIFRKTSGDEVERSDFADAIMTIVHGRKADMRSYIDFCFNAPFARNIDSVVRGFFKIHGDFGYWPSELIAVAQDILARPDAASLAPKLRTRLDLALRDLLGLYQGQAILHERGL